MSTYTDHVLAALADMDTDGLDIASLDHEQSLLDQGLDSLDMMDLYFKLEEATGKKIEFDSDTTQHAQWTSIKDIAEGIAKL